MTAGDTLYEEAAYYRMLFRERTHDTAFYLDACEGEARVLELGIGDGRVATALARGGHTVVGVDASASMLGALEQRLAEETPAVRARVRGVRGDARSVRLDARFARVLFPFNGMAHFHDAEAQAAVLRTVAAHLAPGGHFVFDLLRPDAALQRGGASSVPRVVHPRTGRVCRLEERYRFDDATRVLTVETQLVDRETSATQVLTLAIRHFTTTEAEAMLADNGFTVLARRDDLGDTVAWICASR